MIKSRLLGSINRTHGSSVQRLVRLDDPLPSLTEIRIAILKQFEALLQDLSGEVVQLGI